MDVRADRQEQIAKRQESARRERPQVTLERGDAYFGWYRVAGRNSTYEAVVALEARRQATCTCHDFAVNGLNTCKHIEAVRLELAASPAAAAWRDPLDISRQNIHALDVVVFDAETQRLFQDVGGRKHIDRLGLSLGVLYSLREQAFTTYFEADATALLNRICQADLVVGFNILNFDYPVLEAYGGFRAYRVPTLDLMLLVADELGFRVGLDSLAQATLGTGKTADGLQAVAWYRSGRFDLLEQYCRADVDVTTQLFLRGWETGMLSYTGRDGSYRPVRAAWHRTAAEVAG